MLKVSSRFAIIQMIAREGRAALWGAEAAAS
jgi:hypothetical protein